MQQVAPGAQVDDHRLQAAPRVGVRRAAASDGSRSSASPARRDELGGVGGASSSRIAAMRGSMTSQSWISPSRSWSVLGPLGRRLGVRAEAGRRHLEHVAQALGRDAHVVQRRDLRGIGGRRHEARRARRGGPRRCARRRRPARAARPSRGLCDRRRGLHDGSAHARSGAAVRRAPSPAARAAVREVAARVVERGGEHVVARGLLGAQRVEDDVEPAWSASGSAARNDSKCVDLDVRVPPRAERVGQRLDVAQRPA